MSTTTPDLPLAIPSLAQAIADNLSEGLYILDRNRTIIFWNKAAERISGYRARDVVGHQCKDNILMHVDELGHRLCETLCPVAMSLSDGDSRKARVYLHHVDGHRVPVDVKVFPVRDEAGQIVAAVEIFSEVPDKREMEKRLFELEQALFVDFLTKIPNRAYGEQRLVASLAELSRYSWPFGVLMVDIDHFKRINDTHGHLAGDEILRMVSATLSGGIRPFDLVSRWGGEEFLVVLSNVDAEKIHLLAERLRALVQNSFKEVGGLRLGATVSVGGTLARPEDTIETLLARADEAMYQSKAGGRNRTTITKA
jgi:diguanylate cyclase (GGDEF)-like protein/PAS domain S-box-containing protein